MRVFHGPTVKVHLNRLHEFLVARGWQLDEDSPLDDDRSPADPESAWNYLASYGGIDMNTLDGTPYRLGCRLDFEAGLSIEVSTAGNDNGCPDHDTKCHHIIVDDEDDLHLDRLGVLLDELEPQARQLDPRVLIECRFFGPCGHS